MGCGGVGGRVDFFVWVMLEVQEAKRMKKTFDIMIQEWDHWDVSCSLQSVKT